MFTRRQRYAPFNREGMRESLAEDQAVVDPDLRVHGLPRDSRICGPDPENEGAAANRHDRYAFSCRPSERALRVLECVEAVVVIPAETLRAPGNAEVVFPDVERAGRVGHDDCRHEGPSGGTALEQAPRLRLLVLAADQQPEVPECERPERQCDRRRERRNSKHRCRGEAEQRAFQACRRHRVPGFRPAPDQRAGEEDDPQKPAGAADNAELGELMPEPVLRVVEWHFGATARASVVHRQQCEGADADAEQRRVANRPRGCRSVGIALPERDQEPRRSPGALTVNPRPEPLERSDGRQRKHREERNRGCGGRADQDPRAASGRRRCLKHGGSQGEPCADEGRQQGCPRAGRPHGGERQKNAGAGRDRPLPAPPGSRQRDESSHPERGDHARHVRVEHRPRRTAEQRPYPGAPERADRRMPGSN